MIKTKYGNFGSDKWDLVCHLCLTKKYKDQAFKKLESYSDIFGLKGFTKTGMAFQYFCTDEYYHHDLLMKVQIDQISHDMTKLKQYSMLLSKKLDGIKISKWYFITPVYDKTELISYCNQKREEVKSLNLSILNKNFDILPVDLDFLKPELEIYLKNRDKETGISVLNGSTVFQNEKQITEEIIKQFIEGSILLDEWRVDSPIDYEGFLSITGDLEKKRINNLASYREDKSIIYSKINAAFPFLKHTNILILINYILADWSIRGLIN